MKDGLYQVTTSYLCAGFVVKDGQVTISAPILRKRLAYWVTQGELVGDDLEVVRLAEDTVSKTAGAQALGGSIPSTSA